MINKMKKFFSILYNGIKCLIGKHDWVYLCGNYHTRKDVFECRNCGKQIEQ